MFEVRVLPERVRTGQQKFEFRRIGTCPEGSAARSSDSIPVSPSHCLDLSSQGTAAAGPEGSRVQRVLLHAISQPTLAVGGVGDPRLASGCTGGQPKVAEGGASNCTQGQAQPAVGGLQTGQSVLDWDVDNVAQYLDTLHLGHMGHLSRAAGLNGQRLWHCDLHMLQGIGFTKCQARKIIGKLPGRPGDNAKDGNFR